MSEAREAVLRAPIGSTLWSLAWPIALSNQLEMLSVTILLFWLGRLGGETGLVVDSAFRPFGLMIMWLFASTCLGTSVVVSRSVGANDGRGLDAAAGGVMVAFAMWIAFAVIAGSAAPWLVDLLGGDLEIHRPFLHFFYAWILLTLPGLTFGELLLNVASSTGHTKVNLLRVALDIAFATALTPLLMHVIGIAGAPAAQGLTLLALTGVLWRMLVRRGHALGLGALGPNPWRVRWPLWREILRIGLPVQAGRAVMFFAQLLLMQRVISDGKPSVAAYGIACALLMFVAMLTMGLAQGGGILAGQSIGAGLHDRARKTVTVALVAGWIVVAFVILPLPAYDRTLIGLFTSDPVIIQLAERALAVLRWSALGMASWQLLLAAFAAYGATARAGLLIVVGECCGLAVGYSWSGTGLDAACVGWVVASTVKGLLLVALVVSGKLRVANVATDA